MNPVRVGDFLSLFDGIDDPGMGTTGENHQPFSFYLEEERLFTREGIRFEILAALNQKRLRHLFIGGNPFDVPRKVRPRDDLHRAFHLNHFQPESLDVFFL